ncbi:MAG: hypothetical protein U0Q22_07740 [Acidimicrobiales bacterium]
MPFQITLRDRSVEIIDEADTFAHDKTMTTFYRTGNARRAIDCWSVPVASVRTDEILMIREVETVEVIGGLGDVGATVHQLASA